MDAYLSQYVEQVIDSQEYQNGIFSQSWSSRVFSFLFGRWK